MSGELFVEAAFALLGLLAICVIATQAVHWARGGERWIAVFFSALLVIVILFYVGIVMEACQ